MPIIQHYRIWFSITTKNATKDLCTDIVSYNKACAKHEVEHAYAGRNCLVKVNAVERILPSEEFSSFREYPRPDLRPPKGQRQRKRGINQLPHEKEL